MKSCSRAFHKKENQQEEFPLSALFGILVTAFVFFLISFLCVHFFGTRCTLKFHVNTPDRITVDYDKQIVECTGQQIDGNILTLDFHSVAQGETMVLVSDSDDIAEEAFLYVHPSGIITLNHYFGKCRGDLAFSLSTDILLTLILVVLCREYRRRAQKSLCRNANAWLLGVIFFVGITLLQQIILLIWLRVNGENPSMLEIFEHTFLSSQQFTLILLPVAVLVALVISISNVILMKHEGVRLRNMLGFFLGIFLCFGTFAPFFVYPLLDSIGVNVHNDGSLIVIAVNCTEDCIAAIIAYFECVLLGTAISAVRAAAHIPAFDKDYILILGCRITENGGLTKLLQARADRAVEFAKMQKEATGKDIVFVPSGGKGSDEIISEGEAIRRYLVSVGIPEQQILTENRSCNTEQNLRFSYALIQEQNENAQIAFSTTSYHVFRTGCMADEAGIPVEGIGAKTKRYFWINAFIREFAAALHYEKKNHIKTLLLLLLCILPAEILDSVSYY